MFDQDRFDETYKRIYKTHDIDLIDSFLEETYYSIEKELMVMESRMPSGCCPDRSKAEDHIKYEKLLRDGAYVLNEQAGFYRSVSKWDKCVRAFSKLFYMLDRLNQDGTENYAVALLNQGTAYRAMKRWDEALRCFERSEQILLENRCKNEYVWASLFNNRAPVYMAQKNYTLASQNYLKAIDRLKKIEGTDREIAISQSGLAQAYAAIGKNEEGEIAADNALTLFGKLKEDSYMGSALNSKAIFFYRKGELTTAAEYYKKAAENTEKYFGKNSDYEVCMSNYHALCSKIENKRRFGLC